MADAKSALRNDYLFVVGSPSLPTPKVVSLSGTLEYTNKYAIILVEGLEQTRSHRRLAADAAAQHLPVLGPLLFAPPLYHRSTPCPASTPSALTLPDLPSTGSSAAQTRFSKSPRYTAYQDLNWLPWPLLVSYSVPVAVQTCPQWRVSASALSAPGAYLTYSSPHFASAMHLPGLNWTLFAVPPCSMGIWVGVCPRSAGCDRMPCRHDQGSRQPVCDEA